MSSRLAKLLTHVRVDALNSNAREDENFASSDDAVDPADHLNWQSAFYVGLAALGAAVCIAIYAPEMTWDGWQGFVTLIFLAVAFERVGIKIYGDTHVSSGVVAISAIGIIYGVGGAAIAAPIVVLAATAFTRSRWYTRFFDMSSYTLANVSATLVFHSLIDGEAALSGWWIPVSLIAITVNYVVNAGLVAVLASQDSGRSWLETWREEHSWIFPYYMVFGLLALALAAAYIALGVPGILAFVAPPLMLRFALQQYVSKTEQSVLELKRKNAELEAANQNIMQMTRQLKETYDGTLEALIMALDARDRETKGHSIRVAEYVMLMSRRLGVDEEGSEWTAIRRGALLHDVGKIGVPDQILHKPG
ncbi:MAG: HD domain-containing protein, partial [Chloroflexi bacterium]|nr:HD domain-containing protein [Chloroflexota bacterium]